VVYKVRDTRILWQVGGRVAADSVRLSWLWLTGTHGHMLAYGNICVLSVVGRPPWRVDGSAIWGGGHSSLCVLFLLLSSSSSSSLSFLYIFFPFSFL